MLLTIYKIIIDSLDANNIELHAQILINFTLHDFHVKEK